MQPRTARQHWARPATCIAIGAAALAGALWVRHGLVEPAAMAQACDVQRWQGTCALRSLVIEAFVQQRLAWLALASAALALTARLALLAYAALALGVAAGVLYSADLAAPAVLLALMAVFVPARPGPRETKEAG